MTSGTRNFQSRCGLLICLALMILLTTGAAGEAPRPVFFLVIADAQLGMYSQNQDLQFESENLEKFVAVANRLHPAFIVNCGDLVNKAGDPQQIERYKSIMSKLDSEIPVYNVAGNHDVRNQPTPETLAAYRKTFGRDYYTFHQQGIEGIVLNTSLIKSPELAPGEAEEQSAWLEKTLAEAHAHPNEEIVIFQHIPWFLQKADEPDAYFNLPLSQRKEYLRRFERANVHYIFAGHYHESAAGTEGKIQIRTVSAVGKPLAKDPSGFGVVVVEGRKLRFSYYSVDAPPEQVR